MGGGCGGSGGGGFLGRATTIGFGRPASGCSCGCCASAGRRGTCLACCSGISGSNACGIGSGGRSCTRHRSYHRNSVWHPAGCKTGQHQAFAPSSRATRRSAAAATVLMAHSNARTTRHTTTKRVGILTARVQSFRFELQWLSILSLAGRRGTNMTVMVVIDHVCA